MEVDQTLHFKTLHMGINMSVPFIVKNQITILNSWSVLEEIITFLQSNEESHKVQVLHQQIQAMSTGGGGKKIYCPEIIVRSFSYFALS